MIIFIKLCAMAYAAATPSRKVASYEPRIPGGPQKNGTVDFSGLCSDQQFFSSPCWI